MNIAILGAGGHGRDIAAIAEACGHDVVFFDDNIDWLRPCSEVDLPYLIGVNEPDIRRHLAAIIDEEVVPFSLVDPTATHHRLAVHRHGVVVGPGTHLGPATYLGEHVHVGAGCTVTRTQVGDYVTVGPGCNIAGDCTIGAGAFLGVGVTVKNLVNIGAGARVGAGAVVVRDVAPGETVVCRDLTATGVQR